MEQTIRDLTEAEITALIEATPGYIDDEGYSFRSWDCADQVHDVPSA